MRTSALEGGHVYLRNPLAFKSISPHTFWKCMQNCAYCREDSPLHLSWERVHGLHQILRTVYDPKLRTPTLVNI